MWEQPNTRIVREEKQLATLEDITPKKTLKYSILNVIKKAKKPVTNNYILNQLIDEEHFPTDDVIKSCLSQFKAKDLIYAVEHYQCQSCYSNHSHYLLTSAGLEYLAIHKEPIAYKEETKHERTL